MHIAGYTPMEDETCCLVSVHNSHTCPKNHLIELIGHPRSIESLNEKICNDISLYRKTCFLDLCRDRGTGKMEIGGVGHVAAALHTWAKMTQDERLREG